MGFRMTAYIALVLFVATTAPGQEPEGDQVISGMSIVGDHESPKSLVIVPWKTSEIGDGIGVANMLDGRAQPVDKEVFVRELDYYRLRTTPAPRVAQSAATAELVTASSDSVPYAEAEM